METSTASIRQTIQTKYLLSLKNILVGGFNPFEKYYCSQNGFIFANFRGENKKYLKTQPKDS